jgi:hypothetical protein
MKFALVVFLFAASAFAQNPITVAKAACGPEKVSFDVDKDDTQHTLTLPEPGKARLYFLMDSGASYSLAYPTVKLGMDGAWLGANHDDSYFSVSIEPGEHHLCAASQSSVTADLFELAHFTAEAGKVYYYRTRFILAQNLQYLELTPIDSDQGKYLIAATPLSISTPKGKPHKVKHQ